MEECPGIEAKIQAIRTHTKETLDYPNFNLFLASSSHPYITHSQKEVPTTNTTCTLKRKASGTSFSFDVPARKAPKVKVKFQVTISEGDKIKMQVNLAPHPDNPGDSGKIKLQVDMPAHPFPDQAEGSSKSNPIIICDY
jgi:hypothetical protein